MNELPLRKLISDFDGTTTGPQDFKGPIGQRIKASLIDLDVINFETIEFPCTEIINSDDLNSDQRFLHEICCAISKGVLSEQLKKRKIGPICHSRWTTTANRILRVYVSDEEPSDILKTIAEFIVKVYAPAMFAIKHKSSMVYGPIHLAQIVKSSQFLPPVYRGIVNNNIAINGYFAHPEHITLALLNDEDENIRLKGWNSILTARENIPEEESIRHFRIPEINFSCTSYLNLIDYEKAVHTNPPILIDFPFTRADIDELASKQILEHEFAKHFKKIPCHTQAVERTVKIVTEPSQHVCGNDARDGMILTTLSSRKAMPKFSSKQDYAKSLSF